MPARIQAARARRFTIQVRGERDAPPRKIAKIVFSQSDGSLFVDFPYFENSDGLVSLATLNPGSTEVTLTEGGRVTSHLVKYAHHRDGEAHFSQTGRVYTSVRKRSMPLGNYVGHLFTIQFQGLEGFEVATGLDVDLENMKNKPITFNVINPEPHALKVVGFWYTKRELRARTSDASIGPGVSLVAGGKPYGSGVLLSAPPDASGSGSFLLVRAMSIPPISSEPHPQLTFLGGFDPDHIVNNPAVPTQFLALSYPAHDPDSLKAQIGSIDFVGDLKPPI